MSVYSTFTDKWAASANQSLDQNTHFNNPGQGLQDEFEVRQADLLDGVTSGLVCTTASPTASDLTVAVGRAYVAGKRYGGSSGVVSFTGKAAGDYYVYIDSADDATPYKTKTTAPTSGQLTLCTCTWGGSVFASPYIDDNRKVLGIQRRDFQFGWDGVLNTGKRYPIPVRDDLWIESVEFICVENGSVSGSVTVDCLLGADGSAGTTIFTTQARRPTITTATADYTIAQSGEPDGDRKPDAGEHLTLTVAAIDGGGTASTLSGTVRGRLR